MKFHLFASSALMMAMSWFAAVTAKGDEPVFEEIEIIHTQFEPCAKMVNRGDGFFYGAARYSDQYRGGVIYRVAPRQGVEIVHKFGSVDSRNMNVDGHNPCTGLILGTDGALYGATDFGGTHGVGVIYRISADGIFSVVYNINPQFGLGVTSLVMSPSGDLIGANNYGGGGENNAGTIFRIRPDGTFENLYIFQGGRWYDDPEGGQMPPSSPLSIAIGADGKIYGTTAYGGTLHRTWSSFNGGSWWHWSRGTYFRLEDNNEITILSSFDNLTNIGTVSPVLDEAVSDGFYGRCYGNLLHFDFDGNIRIEYGLDSSIWFNRLEKMNEEIYSVTPSDDALGSFSIFKLEPGGGISNLHDLPLEYKKMGIQLITGNDGMMYGLAAYPPNASAAEMPGVAHAASLPEEFAMAGLLLENKKVSAAQIPGAGTTTSNKSRTFRMRTSAATSSNFVPTAKPDLKWLPAKNSKQGTREVLVDVLANDRDPDGDPLTLASVEAPQYGTIEIVADSRRPRLRYVTSETDPASQMLSYQLADGKGGVATGYVAIKSPAAGSYSGTAAKADDENASAGLLSIKIGNKNTITAAFTLDGVQYKGKSSMDVDDTADVTLKAKGKTSLILHLGLQRDEGRKISAAVNCGGAIYTATCLPVVKK